MWKKEKLHSTINKYIETFDINMITSFYFKIATFKILTQVFISVWITIFIFIFLPPTNLNYSWDRNLFHKSRTDSGTSDFFLLTESLRVITEEKECVPGGLFSLECPPHGHQMFYVTAKGSMTDHLLFICSGSIKSWLFI